MQKNTFEPFLSVVQPGGPVAPAGLRGSWGLSVDGLQSALLAVHTEPTSLSYPRRGCMNRAWLAFIAMAKPSNGCLCCGKLQQLMRLPAAQA